MSVIDGVGFVIQANAPFDEAAVEKLVAATNSPTVSHTVLNNWPYAARLKQIAPASHIYSRNYDADGDEGDWLQYTPEAYFDAYEYQTHGTGLGLQIGNEPGFGVDVIDAYTDFAREAVKRRIPVSLGGFSVGKTPDSAEGWVIYDAFVRLLCTHSDLLTLDVHEYALAVPTSGMYGRDADQKDPLWFAHNWLSKASWPKTFAEIVRCFHAGRIRYLFEYCARKGYGRPTVDIGESLIDFVSDVARIDAWGKSLPSTNPNGRIGHVRGYKSYGVFWPGFVVPGQSIQKTYMDMIEWVRRVVYDAIGVRCMRLFTFGNSGEVGTVKDWTDFDIGTDKPMQKLFLGAGESLEIKEDNDVSNPPTDTSRAISLHIVLDGCDNPAKDRALKHHEIVRPGYTNLTAAAQYRDSFDYMARIKAHSPTTTILFRGYDRDEWASDGLWDRKTDAEWFDHLVAPHVSFFRQYGIVLVLSNESVINSQQFIDREKGAIQRCADVGIPCAGLRSSTGRPPESDYAAFDPILELLSKTGGVLSPNEYTHPEQRWKSGNLARFLRYWDRCDVNGWPRPATVIGEFGTARNIDGWIDAHNGYKTMGLSGRQLAELIIGDAEVWYIPRGVHAMTYCHGNWKNGSFTVDEDYLQTVEEAARAGRLDAPPTEQIITAPPDTPPPAPIPVPPPPPPPPPPPVDPPAPPEVPVPDEPPVLKTYTFPVTIEVKAFNEADALEAAQAMMTANRAAYTFALTTLTLYRVLDKVEDVQMTLKVEG